MKFLFLIWITIRATLDACVWATAVWCLLYSFTNVLWLQWFWIFLAIHFLGNLSFGKYISTHTRQDCGSYIRLESKLVGLSILSAPVIAVIPAAAAILLLSFLQVWTNLETHWLHTFLFVTCLVDILLTVRKRRTLALHVKAQQFPRPRIVRKRGTDSGAGFVAMEVAEDLYGEARVGSPGSPDQVPRSAQKAVSGSRSRRIIDV
jgi:hypothetical protein